ncbi:hypothetical protein MHYP_G00315840 [Metynnis hypsauchen]
MQETEREKIGSPSPALLSPSACRWGTAIALQRAGRKWSSEPETERERDWKSGQLIRPGMKAYLFCGPASLISLCWLLNNAVMQKLEDAVETRTEQSGEGQGQRDKGSHAQRSRQYRTAWD